MPRIWILIAVVTSTFLACEKRQSNRVKIAEAGGGRERLNPSDPAQVKRYAEFSRWSRGMLRFRSDFVDAYAEACASNHSFAAEDASPAIHIFREINQIYKNYTAETEFSDAQKVIEMYETPYRDKIALNLTRIRKQVGFIGRVFSRKRIAGDDTRFLGAMKLMAILGFQLEKKATEKINQEAGFKHSPVKPQDLVFFARGDYLSEFAMLLEFQTSIAKRFRGQSIEFWESGKLRYEVFTVLRAIGTIEEKRSFHSCSNIQRMFGKTAAQAAGICEKIDSLRQSKARFTASLEGKDWFKAREHLQKVENLSREVGGAITVRMEVLGCPLARAAKKAAE